MDRSALAANSFPQSAAVPRGILNALNAAELLPESPDEFSTAPYDFEESAKILWDDTRLTYDHACTANRFSEDYLKLCGRLEKNIRQVGSYCLTKTALEQNGMSFPGLEEMKISGLIGMVSFHLRKCHAAFQGIYQNNNFLGMSYLNWEFRWVALGEQLKVTEAKAQKIREGKITTDLFPEKPEETSASHTKSPARLPQSLRFNPNALPINGSMAREMIRIQKEEEKREKEAEKLLNDAYKIWNTKPVKIPPASLIPALIERNPVFPYPIKSETTGKTRTEFLPVEEARKILLDHAQEQGDAKALAEIPHEDAYTLAGRWLDFCEKPLTDTSETIKPSEKLSGEEMITREKVPKDEDPDRLSRSGSSGYRQKKVKNRQKKKH